MILHSYREMDVTFVSKVISDQKLDPTPSPGFHARTDYWLESGRYRRVVERYPWGAVLFCDDREKGQHVTAVAVGKFDPNSGKVTLDGKVCFMPMSWYTDLVRGLKLDHTHKQPQLTVPPCLGFHETDHVCNGGMNLQTKKQEPVCGWRKQCVALQRHAANRGRYQEELLRGKSPEAILQLATRLLENEQANPTAEVVRPKPQPKKRPKADPGKPPSLRDIAHDIVGDVAEATSRSIVSDRSSLLAGDLLIVDRTARSDYVSLYLAQSQGTPKAICSLRLRVKSGGFRIQLPIPKDDPLLAKLGEQDCDTWLDGAFQSSIRDVTPGKPKMELTKQILVQLIQKETESK